MNPIQQFVEKYNGLYKEEFEKGTYTPDGKYSFQPKWGTLTYYGKKYAD